MPIMPHYSAWVILNFATSLDTIYSLIDRRNNSNLIFFFNFTYQDTDLNTVQLMEHYLRRKPLTYQRGFNYLNVGWLPSVISRLRPPTLITIIGHGRIGLRYIANHRQVSIPLDTLAEKLSIWGFPRCHFAWNRPMNIELLVCNAGIAKGPDYAKESTAALFYDSLRQRGIFARLKTYAYTISADSRITFTTPNWDNVKATVEEKEWVDAYLMLLPRANTPDSMFRLDYTPDDRAGHVKVVDKGIKCSLTGVPAVHRTLDKKDFYIDVERRKVMDHIGALSVPYFILLKRIPETKIMLMEDVKLILHKSVQFLSLLETDFRTQLEHHLYERAVFKIPNKKLTDYEHLNAGIEELLVHYILSPSRISGGRIFPLQRLEEIVSINFDKKARDSMDIVLINFYKRLPDPSDIIFEIFNYVISFWNYVLFFEREMQQQQAAVHESMSPPHPDEPFTTARANVQ